MKKFLIFFSLIAIAFNTYSQEYDIKEKEVIGQDKWERNVDIKDKKDVNLGEVKEEKEKVQVNLEKIDFYDDIQDEIIIDDIEIENIIKTEDMSYNISIYSTRNVIVDTKTVDVAPKDNYVIFGMGGYKEIDAFKYIVDYTKKDEDLSYYLHLGRDIKGEYRDNSDLKIDNYFGKIWYKNFNFSASHTIQDKEIAGREDAAVYSFRETRETDLNTEYKISVNDNNNILFSGEYYHKGMDTDPIREYNSDYYNVTLKYDTIFNIGKIDNIFDIKLSYANESRKSPIILDGSGNNYDVSNSFIKLIFNDNIKIRENNTMQFYFNGGIESASKETLDKELNYLASIKGVKRIGDFEIGLKGEKDTINKEYRTLLKDFVFDDDIIVAGDLKNQEDTMIELTGTYMKEKLYATIGAAYKYSKDKIVFSELKDPITPSNPLILGDSILGMYNHFESLDWIELKLEGSYSFSDIRAKLKYVYSTLNEIGFSPENTINLDLIYAKNKFETRLSDVYYSGMYDSSEKINSTTNNTNRNEIKGYNVLSWYNTYKVNDSLELGLNIENLIGENADYKTGYPISDRKYIAEVKIKY